MTKPYQEINQLLGRGLVFEALNRLEPLVKKAQNPALSSLWDNIHLTYRYWADYYLGDKADPNRASIHCQTVRQCYELLDKLWGTEWNQKYLSSLRNQQNGATSYPFGEWVQLFYQYLLTPEPITLPPSLLAPPTESDASQPYHLLPVAGLTLNCLNRFDEQHILALLQLMQSPSGMHEQAALGIVFIFEHYQDRLQYYPTLLASLLNAFTVPSATHAEPDSPLPELAYRLLVYALQTTLNHEAQTVLQDMQKDILDSQKGNPQPAQLLVNLDDLSEGNPQWSEQQNRSFNRKIDKVMRLHQSGADLNYSTSQAFLSHTFFQDHLVNWFMPFSLSHPDLHLDIDSPCGQMARKVVSLDAQACSVDQYATCLAFQSMQTLLASQVLPDEIKDMTDFDIQQQEQEIQKADALLHYTRTLYRFFKHNRLGFQDAFASVADWVRFPLWQKVGWSEETEEELVDECLNLSLFGSAEYLLKTQLTTPSAAHFEKLGFALQQQGRYSEAVQTLQKALLLEESAWATQHLTACYCQLGEWSRALEGYEQLITLFPDKPAYWAGKAKCLEALGQYEEALQGYFRLEMEYPGKPAYQRGLALCCLKNNRLDTAIQYFEKVVQTENNPELENDALRLGVLYFLRHEHLKALPAFQKAYASASVQRAFLSHLEERVSFFLTTSCASLSCPDKAEVSCFLDCIKEQLRSQS